MSAYLPPQHGAWAFLGLPLALGLTQATWTPWLLVLAVAWIAAFPLSYAALALVRSRGRHGCASDSAGRSRCGCWWCCRA